MILKPYEMQKHCKDVHSALRQDFTTLENVPLEMAGMILSLIATCYYDPLFVFFCFVFFAKAENAVKKYSINKVPNSPGCHVVKIFFS